MDVCVLKLIGLAHSAQVQAYVLLEYSLYTRVLHASMVSTAFNFLLNILSKVLLSRFSISSIRISFKQHPASFLMYNNCSTWCTNTLVSTIDICELYSSLSSTRGNYEDHEVARAPLYIPYMSAASAIGSVLMN